MCSLQEKINNSSFDREFEYLYGEVDAPKKRYLELLDIFNEDYPNSTNLSLFSAPGRIEIIGNHTDHQHGIVIAQAVQNDTIAIVEPTCEDIISIHSVGHNPNFVRIDDLEKKQKELNTSNSIIRGVSAYLKNEGYKIGGFNAVTSSHVPTGSGMSSSAAFEVLVGTIINHLYNNGSIPPEVIAKAGQYAENVYFGKPSGLMDQMASSVGGMIYIDFNDPDNAIIEKMKFDISKYNYNTYIVKTGGSHSDLTDEYAAIPYEMNRVCEQFGVKYLRELSYEQVVDKTFELRKIVGDRAILRALNFFDEMDRVRECKNAVISNDIDSFLKVIKESGDGSYKYLQNVHSEKNSTEQGIALGLKVTNRVLDNQGASRVHGGGFAGTALVFVPFDKELEFNDMIESVFGNDSYIKVHSRDVGGYKLTEN